jgi:hypothetical protein
MLVNGGIAGLLTHNVRLSSVFDIIRARTTLVSYVPSTEVGTNWTVLVLGISVHL